MFLIDIQWTMAEDGESVVESCGHIATVAMDFIWTYLQPWSVCGASVIHAHRFSKGLDMDIILSCEDFGRTEATAVDATGDPWISMDNGIHLPLVGTQSHQS
jgi:hypothetical protein